MRTFASILALVAVFAFVGASFADLTVTVERQADPAPGLECYWLVASGAQQYESFTDWVFENVHQVNNVYGPYVEPTIYLDQSTTTGGTAQDTHYLFPSTNVLSIVAATETNTAAGVPAYGLGNFNGGTISPPPLVDSGSGVAFLQVVIPAGEKRMYEARLRADGQDAMTFSGEIGGEPVPEPGTIAMLFAGALCFVVARFRRK